MIVAVDCLFYEANLRLSVNSARIESTASPTNSCHKDSNIAIRNVYAFGSIPWNYNSPNQIFLTLISAYDISAAEIQKKAILQLQYLKENTLIARDLNATGKQCCH